MATYRRPVPEDLPKIMRLAKEMHSETSFRTLSFDDGKAAAEIMANIVNPDVFVVVAEERGQIVGIVAAFLSKPFFSEDTVVYDHIWYVGKDSRGSMVGPRLLKSLSQWAVLCRAKAVFVTLGSDVSQERVGKLVEKLGYRRLGGYFRKDISGG